MTLKDIIMKLRWSLLCCSQRERKSSLDIGPPTNVCRVDISDALPGLTDAERKYIREKASSDAIHLLSLQSRPSSRSPSSPPSPTHSHSPPPGSASILSSREPSEALLNAASKDLPSTLPTPPRRQHNENSPPAARMKSMWDSNRRPSNSSASGDALYEKLEQAEEREARAINESFTTLNLDFKCDDKPPRRASVHSLSPAEGFEMQDTTGGHSQSGTPMSKKHGAVTRAVKATEVESSDSEDDVLLSKEAVPLVKI
ncbi:hypothetical protein IQ07DRAFT_595859 [Pyrenochaeta sp. DS3sAY3a]|nr:hypothetical protein IQ07DRAFT_595859 [Pyrenochaeta sp. DS3sAY3a]